MTGGQLLRTVGILGVGILLLADVTPLPKRVAAWVTLSPRLEPAHAIVVLASQIASNGELSDPSLRRAIHGIVLYRRGLAPLLVFSGGDPEGGPNEAEARAALARELGVPAQSILTDAGARTTLDEARRLALLLENGRGVRRVLLVTDELHMPRAAAVFARAGFTVLPAPVGSADLYLPTARSLVEAGLAWFYYRLAGHI